MTTVFSGALVAQGSRFLRRSLSFRFCSSSCANLRSSRAFAMDSMVSNGGGIGVVRFPLSATSALVIQKGDITKWFIDGSTDAIVNPANERMLGGDGADGAIHRAAGPELLQACLDVPEVKAGVRCPTGEARITPGFRLPASHVIHTVGPIYNVDGNPAASLASAYRNSLRVAKENSIQYIAFPAISCGVYGYPFDEAATVAISSIREFQNDFKESGTKLRYSTTNHPETDGQTEVVNICLETYLRCFVGMKPKQWVKWLSWAELWFNTNYNASTNTCPFKVLYGRDPPALFKSDSSSTMEDINRSLAERDVILDELKWQLTNGQERMRNQAKQEAKGAGISGGRFGISETAALSYEVLERIGQVAYRLALPEGSLVHPVFHVSLLKGCVAKDVQPQPFPAGMTDSWELQLKPLAVLAIRDNNQGGNELLIRWSGMPDFEASWELAEDNKLAFPEFHLEDKVHFPLFSPEIYDIWLNKANELLKD